MKANKLFLFFLFLAILFLFQHHLLIQEAMLQCCQIFLTKVFPSLFPMMIVADLLIYFDFPDLLWKYFGKFLQKILHLCPDGLFVFFVSCFSGTPTNIYVLKEMYLQQRISKKESEKLLSFSFFANPLFSYTMMQFLFPNSFTALKLFFLPYVVNFFLGMTGPKINAYSSISFPEQKISLGSTLTKTIKNAMNTLLFILGTMCLFFLINAFLNPMGHPLVSGFLEMSQGLYRLGAYMGSEKIKELMATSILSFGGLSIHLQVKGILEDTSLSYFAFFKGRIKQWILSVFLIFIF